MDIPTLLQEIITALKTVPGIRAVALGGSRARGQNHAGSDIDLGLYYHPRQPLDLASLARVASQLDDQHRPDLVTAPGGWGPWINGGGWLQIQSMPVDFIYRDLEQLSQVIDACLEGRVEMFYQPGHPNGFISSIYLAETAICQPLWDPEGLITELKNRVTPYPDRLQKALIDKFAWEIDFSIRIAHKSIARADITYAAGCCFRGVMCLLQVLFALNREYWLNEKGALAIANRFEYKPANLQSRVEEIFESLRANPSAIRESVAILEGLSAEINELLSG